MDSLSHEVLGLSEMLEDQRETEQQHEIMQAWLTELELAANTARNELKQSQDKFRQQNAQLLMLREKVAEQDATISNMVNWSRKLRCFIDWEMWENLLDSSY